MRCVRYRNHLNETTFHPCISCGVPKQGSDTKLSTVVVLSPLDHFKVRKLLSVVAVACLWQPLLVCGIRCLSVQLLLDCGSRCISPRRPHNNGALAVYPREIDTVLLRPDLGYYFSFADVFYSSM